MYSKNILRSHMVPLFMQKAVITAFKLSPCIYQSMIITKSSIIDVTSRGFGIIQEYNERKSKKLTNFIQATEEPKFWVTPSRPSNFGDHLDTKTKLDNWFD